jgi:hypothetical protein
LKTSVTEFLKTSVTEVFRYRKTSVSTVYFSKNPKEIGKFFMNFSKKKNDFKGKNRNQEVKKKLGLEKEIFF